MSEPHPQVSPDGKFYWDGERWQPVQGPPPSQPPSPKPYFSSLTGCVLGGCGGLVVMVVMLFVIFDVAQYH